MEDDKSLKALLQQWAMEEAPIDFTQNIMHRIEANATAKQPAIPFFKNKVLRRLAAAFVLIFVVLLVISITSQLPAFSFDFAIAIPYNYISQLLSFIIVFWVVMAGNQLYQRRNKHGF